MSRRILERLALSLLVVFGAVSLIFAILNWLPGDVATMVAGDNASAETIEHVRAQLGTSRSLLQQYTEYLAGLVQGDLGRSYVTKQPVWDRLAEQFPSTLVLTFSSALIAIILGIALGVLAALYRGRWPDQLIQMLSLTVVSVPSFWLGILAILLFSVKLGLLPVLGSGGLSSSILPVSCLGLVVSVPLARVVREGILDGQSEPYVLTLRAKGLAERRIVYVHVLRNALIATVTMLSVTVGELLSGAVIIETLFARQGIGRVTVEAIGQKDLPVVQGAILLASVSYVLINLLVDVSYTLIDPRTRMVVEKSS